MSIAQQEEKKAVQAGYWNTFRFDPRAKAEGKNPLTVDSKAPTASYKDFIMNEVRYSSLTRSNPEKAEVLFNRAAEEAANKYNHLLKLQEMYGAE